jgi:hypothetical protein
MLKTVAGTTLAVITASIVSFAITAAIADPSQDEAPGNAKVEPVTQGVVRSQRPRSPQATTPIRVILPAPWELAPQSR